MAKTLDLIQARYGYTDEYILDKISYARMLQLAEQAVKGQNEELRRLTFLGWLFQSPFFQDPKPYEEYHNSLFRTDTEGQQSGEIQATKEMAIEKAEAILARFRGGEKNGTI